MFVLEEGKTRELALKDTTFLAKHTLTAGAWVNDNLIALGTLKGGVIL